MSTTYSVLLITDRSLDDIARFLGQLAGAEVVPGRSWNEEVDGSIALVMPEGTSWIAPADLVDEPDLPLSRYHYSIDGSEPNARHIYDLLVASTDWPVALYDEQQPRFVAQRPTFVAA